MDSKVQKMLSGSLYVILAVILGFSVILVWPVYCKYRAKQEEVKIQQQKQRNAMEECQMLIREVHDLEHTSFAVEKVAREKYKICREDEQIMIYK